MKIIPKLHLFLAYCVSALLSSGCAFRESSHPSSSENVQNGNVVPAAVRSDYSSDQWDESVVTQDDATMEVRTLKSQYRTELKQRFKVPELVEIKSLHAGTFTLYRVANVESAASLVFIQPKLFVHGTSQGGNVLSVRSPNGGRVTLTIPISFVDGLSSSLTSYDGHDAVLLPKTLFIPKIDALKEDLKRQMGREIQLQALPSCPRELTLIHVHGTKTDRHRLTPTITNGRCAMNEFFTASLNTSKDEAEAILEDTLLSELSVQILSQFRVEYRVPVSVFTLSLNSTSIYQKIRDKFLTKPFGISGEPTLYLPYQLITPLQSLVSKEIAKLGANAAWVPYSQGISLLEKAFFEEVSEQMGCSAQQRCFRVKRPTDVNFDQPFELMWMEEETLGASPPISTLTMVRGLDESYPFVLKNQRAPEGNKSSKAAISQFQVFPGSKIRLNINQITEWRYELPVPRDDTPAEFQKGSIRCANSRTIPDACIEYQAKCPVGMIDFCARPKSECEFREKTYALHCSDETSHETNCGFLGMGRCNIQLKENRHVCQRVETGDFCKSYKTSCETDLQKVCPVELIKECITPVKACEQYTLEFFSKYTYSQPWLTPQILDLSKGESPEQLWEGLDLEFTSLKEDGTGYDRTVCPLLAFPHWLDGRYSLTLSLGNQKNTSCQPFTDWNQKEGRWPSIAIINRISFDRRYQCGSLEWTHSIDSTSRNFTKDTMLYSCPLTGEQSVHPLSVQYQPIVDLEGTIALLGKSMTTTLSQRTSFK